MTTRLLAGLLLAVALQGCARLEPPDYGTLDKQLDPLLAETANASLADHQTLAPEQRANRVRERLAQPLTPALAQEVALMNSPFIRAELAKLGIANAERVQSQLISNPTLAVGALRPEGGGRWQLDLGLSQSLLDLLTLPLRRDLAEDAFARAQLELLSALNRELHQVGRQYYEALGARHRVHIAELSLEAAEANYLLAASLHEAGNLKELTLLHYRDAKQQQERALRKAKSEQQRALMTLSLSLGVTDLSAIQLPDRLPGLPDGGISNAEKLIDQALTRRPDIQLARQDQQLADQLLALNQRRLGLTQLELGINAERETDGSNLLGPEVAFSLPLFDRNQARRANAEAQQSQTRAQEQALALQIRTEIHSLLTQLHRLRQDIQQLEQQVIPQWQRQVQLSQEEYNFMLVGAFDLLTAKGKEFAAWREHAESLEAYWKTRARLAMASATPLPTSDQAAPMPQLEDDGQTKDHHHHNPSDPMPTHNHSSDQGHSNGAHHHD